MAEGQPAVPLCDSCGKPVPPKAAVCPNCGALNLSSDRQRFINKKNRTWLIVLGTIGLVAFLVPFVIALGIFVICSGLFQNYH